MKTKKGLFRRFIDRIKGIYYIAKSNVLKSLRLQLILVFAVCLIASSIAGGISSDLSKERYATLDYSASMDSIDDSARQIVEEINDRLSNQESFDENPDVKEKVYANVYPNEQPPNNIDEIVAEIINNHAPDLKILVVDLDGVVHYKSKDASEAKVDIHGIIRNAMDTRINQNNYEERKEFTSFYPVELNTQKAYVVVSAIPEPYITYRYSENELFTMLTTLATFFVLFYLLTKRKMDYIEELAQGLREISKGDLSYRVTQKSSDELGSLAQDINNMAQELKFTIEEERKAEKAKNELITNVSHDLRTPLTSVMGYLRLLQDKKYENQEQAETYLNIAYGKADKLKSLIEDLFEYTKLTNNAPVIKPEVISIDEMIEQLIEEFVPVAEENRLSFIKNLPLEKLMVEVEVDKIVRVFENLLMNAIRYSYKPGKIKVSVAKDSGYVTVSIHNKGDNIPPEDLEHLFDRFYKVEKSRTSDLSGSGLGLAIAKNIAQLHGGSIWAECKENDIYFHVKLKLA